VVCATRAALGVDSCDTTRAGSTACRVTTCSGRATHRTTRAGRTARRLITSAGRATWRSSARERSAALTAIIYVTRFSACGANESRATNSSSPASAFVAGDVARRASCVIGAHRSPIALVGAASTRPLWVPRAGASRVVLGLAAAGHSRHC
jgi:hypothetical protein